MSIYIVTAKATGAEIYRYSADAPIEWSGMQFADFDHTLEVEAPGTVTDVIPRMYSRRLTKLQFVGLLGDSFAGILSASKVNVDVEMFVKMLDWATPDADGTSVDLDDPRVAGGLALLEDGGLLPTGRAAEILGGV